MTRTGPRPAAAVRALALLAASVPFAAAACGGGEARPGADPARGHEQPALEAVPVPFPATFPVPVPIVSDDQPPIRFAEEVAAYVGTYTLLARDAATGDLGVGVVSSVPAGGALIPGARAGVGAVAVAARPDLQWKERALDLLEDGKSAQEVVDLLVTKPETDDAKRQIVVLDRNGGIAHFTGYKVLFAQRNSFVVEGEGLAVLCCLLNPGYPVVDAMVEAFRGSRGLPLTERLLLAMRAGWSSQRPDRPGEPGNQLAPHPPLSAGLLVVREEGGYDGRTDVLADLRVDLSRDAVPRLVRSYEGWVQMVLGPRLRDAVRLLSTDDPLYEPTREWIERLSEGKGVGER